MSAPQQQQTVIDPAKMSAKELLPQHAKKTPLLREALARYGREVIQEVAPKHMTADKLVRLGLLAVSRSPLLGECTINSILHSLLISAQLGLDCSGVGGQAYMVPFYNGRLKMYEAQLIPGYRGLIDLALRSAKVLDISAYVVYEGDNFKVSYGTDKKIVHEPNFENERTDDKIIAAYMVAELAGGLKHIEVTPRSELDKIREFSKGAWKTVGSGDDAKRIPIGPYRDWLPEMFRKAPIRRGSKQLPASIEFNRVLEMESGFEQGMSARQVAELLDLKTIPEDDDGNGKGGKAKRVAARVGATPKAEDIPQAEKPDDEPQPLAGEDEPGLFGGDGGKVEPAKEPAPKAAPVQADAAKDEPKAADTVAATNAADDQQDEEYESTDLAETPAPAQQTDRKSVV